MKKLKPCPECNSTDVIKFFHDRYGVRCRDCGILLYGFSTEKKAIKAWNTLSSPWINVKDRLPDKEYKTDKFSKIIIICYDSIYGKSVTTGYYDYELKRWNHSDCDAHPDVVCYQYLPEPPEDE